MSAQSLYEIAKLPALLSPAQAGKVADVDPRTIINLIKRGAIPAVRVGRSWRIKTRDYIKFLALEEDVEDVKEMLGTSSSRGDAPCVPECLVEVREERGRRTVSFRRVPASQSEEPRGTRISR